MLKMLKYEFRRGIFPLLIVGIVIAAIELYFLISTLTEHADHSIIAVSLLILAAFCCYLFVLIYGIISYSQDLKNKSGVSIVGTPFFCLPQILSIFIFSGLTSILFAKKPSQFNMPELLNVFFIVFYPTFLSYFPIRNLLQSDCRFLKQSL